MKKSSLILALLALTLPNLMASPDDAEIIRAAESFLYANATVTTKVNFAVEQVDGDFARVRINPQDKPTADAAWIFLKKTDGKWTGLTVGSSFTTEDYQQLGLPNALRIP